ncbi:MULTISPECIES: TetR/AcrR family transcriptional regulator [Streptomyces]|uniref:TetR family transcriptional regulator n=1 Tax=Streptomyces lasiicapitis TaxID=1923961 RepID=A0ABQ2LH22_9ACTN|nr:MULTISPECIES: TetR/AcrR family transcriptional regulator [Streptomyces]QIB43469.1 TetR/AcrR family transcriptional regulator [Streptomyces aureoverticillatus]GGO33048.1 TetR family transcriptional regulator [Streptomyces lasiicapitis]
MRNRLLNAAERLLVKQGVDAIRLEAVAAEAGVSKGGLLYHFPTKLALVQGVVERLADRFEEVLPGPDAPPGAYARAWLDASIPPEAPEGESTPSDSVPVALLAAANGPEVLGILQGRYQVWQERLERDGLPPGVATLVRMAVDGWWTARLLGLADPKGEQHVQLRRLVHDLTEQYADGQTKSNAMTKPNSTTNAKESA